MTNETKKKFKSADDVAQEYLELQLSMKKESRFSNILLIVLTLGFIYALSVLFWVMPDKDFSPTENTTLSTFPEFSSDSFFHLSEEYNREKDPTPTFQDEFAEYMADQFPFRDFFVGVKALSEAVQLKGENNSVIFGDDDYLFARNDYPDMVADPSDPTVFVNYLDKNISDISAFCNKAEENGITCIPAFAGRKIDVLDKYLPETYGSFYSDRIFSMLHDYCKEGNITPLDLRESLKKIAAKSDEQIYYRTDHHWTSLGAYYAYCEVIKALGETPYALSDFKKETATEEFYGTTWSSAGAKWIDADSIEYYRWEGDENITMRIKGKIDKFEGYEGCTYETGEDGKTYTVFNSYFVREFLSEKDKYASFMGGNYGYTEIRNGEDRETLVIFKDSFSHSMVQFLSRHYDLILIDLRYEKVPPMRFCTENNIEKVLFLYNMETLTEANYLKVLRAGLGK